jgi:hypothetical protein
MMGDAADKREALAWLLAWPRDLPLLARCEGEPAGLLLALSARGDAPAAAPRLLLVGALALSVALSAVTAMAKQPDTQALKHDSELAHWAQAVGAEPGRFPARAFQDRDASQCGHGHGC